MNKIFAIIFGLIAITELTGFVTGHGLHCLMAAIFTGLFAAFLYWQSKHKTIKIRTNGRI